MSLWWAALAAMASVVVCNGMMLFRQWQALQSLRRAIRETDRLNALLADVVVQQVPRRGQPTEGGVLHGRFG